MPNFDEKGLRKAAILLMSMPTKNAAQVLGQLPPSYIEAVSIMIAQIDSVGGDDQEIVIADFLTSKASSLYASPGGLERAKELIKEALGRDAGELLATCSRRLKPCRSASSKRWSRKRFCSSLAMNTPKPLP